MTKKEWKEAGYPCIPEDNIVEAEDWTKFTTAHVLKKHERPLCRHCPMSAVYELVNWTGEVIYVCAECVEFYEKIMDE